MKKKIFSSCIYDHSESCYHDKHHLKIKLKCVKRDYVDKLLRNCKMTTVNDNILQKRDMI